MPISVILDEKLNDLFIQTSRIFGYLVLLVMTAFTIFGHPFVIRWAGAEYDKSYAIGMLLAFLHANKG